MTKKTTHLLLLLAVAGTLLFAGSAFGQSSTASPAQPAPAPSGVNPTQPAPNPVQPAPKEPGGAGIHDPGHPAVNEINDRLEQQKKGIQEGVKNGTLTKQQAEELWRNDQRIANQERRDMAANGGHLSKQQQQQLNNELTKNRHQIYKQKHQ